MAYIIPRDMRTTTVAKIDFIPRDHVALHALLAQFVRHFEGQQTQWTAVYPVCRLRQSFKCRPSFPRICWPSMTYYPPLYESCLGVP